MVQSSLQLQPKEFYSLRHFIPHSGVSEAYNTLIASLDSKVPVFVFGPTGSGKTHLLEGFKGLCDGAPRVFTLEKDVFTLPSVFEECRAKNQRLLVECECSEYSNPHITSRINNGLSLTLSYPVDSELLPIMRAIAERNQIKLDFSVIESAVRKLPKNMHVIEKVISQLFNSSLEQQAKSGPRLLNKVLGELL